MTCYFWTNKETILRSKGIVTLSANIVTQIAKLFAGIATIIAFNKATLSRKSSSKMSYFIFI